MMQNCLAIGLLDFYHLIPSIIDHHSEDKVSLAAITAIMMLVLLINLNENNLILQLVYIIIPFLF